jgi:hypothetical protein
MLKKNLIIKGFKLVTSWLMAVQNFVDGLNCVHGDKNQFKWRMGGYSAWLNGLLCAFQKQ